MSRRVSEMLKNFQGEGEETSSRLTESRSDDGNFVGTDVNNLRVFSCLGSVTMSVTMPAFSISSPAINFKSRDVAVKRVCSMNTGKKSLPCFNIFLVFEAIKS